MIKKYIFLLLWYLPSVGMGQEREFSFYNYTTENGLPTNTYEFVYRDSYGFLWLASFDGLFRWDGYTFKKYHYDEKNTNSIDNNIVYTIFEDSRRRLWVGTMGGLNLYHPATDSFEKCILQAGRNTLPVNCIMEDRLNRLWLGTSVGLCRYDYDTKKSHWYTSGQDVIFCMSIDTTGSIWLGTFNTGLKKFDPSTGHFQPLPVAGNRVSCLLAATNNHIWVGTDDKGLLELNNEGVHLHRYRQFLNISCLYEDGHNTLWIGVNRDVLFCKRPVDAEPVPVSGVVRNHTGEKLESISSIAEDGFGNIWFASLGSGLFNTNRYKNRFRHYSVQPGGISNPQSHAVNCFFEYRPGKIWVGTNGSGIVEFDTATHALTPLFTAAGSSDAITDIKKDNGKIWIATWGAGIKVIDSATRRITAYRQQAGIKNTLITDDIKAILPDDSLVWIGTHGEGLVVFNRNSNRFIDYRNNTILPFDMHAPAWINHLYKDARKRLWISTYSGIFVFDGTQLRAFRHNSDSSSIGSNSVNMVTEDAGGNIWVVHETGLDRFDERSQRFTRYTNKYNLPPALKSVTPDKGDLLWISCNEGIIQFDVKTGLVKRYGADDGLAANAYQKMVFRASGANVYAGGARGFNVFNTGRLQPLQLPAYFYFTELYIYNERQQPGAKGSVLQNELAFTDTIVLKHTQSFFSIGFAALNLYAPGKTQYSYRLQGLHDQWIDLNGERKASFTHLPAGHFVLNIRFTDADGKWQTAARNLHIIVLPAWWQTWWFRLLVLLFIIGAVIAVFYWRVLSIKKRNRLLKEQVTMRTLELQEMNASLVEQRDEVQQQKEELEASNLEIRRQTDKILDQQQHIISQNQALSNTVSELEKLNHTKDHFFSIVAHDLKNPVFALTDMAAYVRQHLQKIDRHELERYLNSMHHSADAVYELLINLLNWSLSQSKQIAGNPANCRVSQLVAQNVRLLQPQLGQKNIQVHVHTDEAHAVLADYNMLDTVIRNILSNSIKFTGYNGSVTISSEKNAAEISICITDTGVGMTEEQVNNLFSIEKTIVAAGTAGEKGTGLGLVIAREFVDINKGQITVQSEKGKGTSFCITLPVADPAKKLPVIKDAGKEDGLNAGAPDFWDTFPVDKLAKIKGRKILIVDDNPEMRDYLKRLLSGSFEIFEAADGKEGLAMSLETPPDIIITDLLMPGIGGLQFCREIKTGTFTSHIPVVILTSQWEENIQVSGYEAGAALYLTKPVKKELLIQVILNLLQNQEQQHAQLVQRMLDDQPVMPGNLSISKPDEAFLGRLIAFVEEHMADATLDARVICKEMAVSRTVLYAKLKALTGQTVHEFIKSIRLRRSLRLLLEGSLTINQVAYEVGFSSHSYFDKCFTKQFNMGPREYIKKKRGG